MIHLIFLFKRRGDVERNEFLHYWREVHAPLTAELPGVRRYVQNSVLPVAGQVPSYDCVDEIWVDDETPVDTLLRSASCGKSALTGAGGLIDPLYNVTMQTSDYVVCAGPRIGREEVLPKRMTFFKRKPGLTREDMLLYWRGTHGPAAASVPRLRRYVQSATLPTAYAPGEPRFDGAAQIWFEDNAALRTAVGSQFFRETVKPDEANFVATDTVLTLSMDEERRVVWPEAA